MKTSIDDIVGLIESRHDEYYMDKLSPEEFVAEAFRALVDQELDNQREELQRFDGKKFTTMGKIDLLNEIEQEVEKL